jgi:hypothetical protein
MIVAPTVAAAARRSRREFTLLDMGLTSLIAAAVEPGTLSSRLAPDARVDPEPVHLHAVYGALFEVAIVGAHTEGAPDHACKARLTATSWLSIAPWHPQAFDVKTCGSGDTLRPSLLPSPRGWVTAGSRSVAWGPSVNSLDEGP